MHRYRELTLSPTQITFITTGDIHAMWLRDSANQLQSYVSLLKPAQSVTAPAQSKDGASSSPQTRPSTLASLFRGAINLQARYILASPYCNAFHPPVEAEMAPGNDGNLHDLVFPAYDPSVVFECKYELDSLAAFLQLSWDYFHKTKDMKFFVDASSSGGRPSRRGRGKKTANHRQKKKKKDKSKRGADGWRDAVVTILDTAETMRQSTYEADGLVQLSPYRFERVSSVPTETLGNRGNGSPVRAGTGLVRSAFRPSDDATTYQFLIPANMMLARYLELCAEIMAAVEKEEDRLAALAESQGHQQGLVDDEAEDEGEEEEGDEEGEVEGDEETVTERMRRMAKEIKKGVDKYGKIKHPEFGEIYAYEVDGYWSSNTMVSARYLPNGRLLPTLRIRNKTR